MKNISMDLVRVTEEAAIAASAWIGSGDKLLADKAATDAMRKRLNKLDIDGTIQIGEGKKDESYGLFKGEKVGSGNQLDVMTHLAGMADKPKQFPQYDIALDPIDGTTPTVNSGPEATSVIAVAQKDSMFNTDEHYMLKFAVSGKVAATGMNKFDLNAPIGELCKDVASCLGKSVDKLVVCILNRSRHEHYIQEMRKLGVRIKLIQDCDISGAIAAAEGNIDMQFGVGGAPEAVVAAAAIKCLGGFFLAQVWKDNVLSGDVLSQDDLVKGHCCFAATGITDGSLLKGVSWDKNVAKTHSVFMRSESKTVRWVETRHGN
jgi:fructose-1,6-bisphosphatase/sedoheptulose 1,7-bisphosphatase-like protein